MAQFKNEIVIDRPLDFVFNFMVEKMDDYLVRLEPNILIVEQITEGEVSVGTQFRIISSKSGADRDPTKAELLRGLDLDALDADLRKEIKVAFVEVTKLERNELLETIRVAEDNHKTFERYTFEGRDSSTVLKYSMNSEISKIKGEKEKLFGWNSKVGVIALGLFWPLLAKFSFGLQLKSLKTMIEAEPLTAQTETGN